MRGLAAAFLIGCAWVSAAAAQPAPEAGPAPRYASVEFGRLVVDVPAGQPWLILGQGIACLPVGSRRGDGMRRELTIPHAQAAFLDEVARAGFGVEQRADDLFAPQGETGAAAADFVASGVVTDIQERVCEPLPNSTAQEGSMRMTVQWSLWSKARKEVVMTAYAHVNVKTRLEADALHALVNMAFLDAVRQFAADPEIRRALSEGAAAAMPAADPVLPAKQPPMELTGSLAALPRGIAAAADSVVLVRTAEGHGSGFLVSTDGAILTDAHVVGDTKTVTIRWSDGAETKGQVIRLAKGRDVALVMTDPRGHAPLALRQDAPAPGDTVFAIGAPLDEALQGTVMRGVISAHRVQDGFDMLQSDANVNHGMSGGPVLDERGRVVALVESGRHPEGAPIEVNESINYVTPIADALRYLALVQR